MDLQVCAKEFASRAVYNLTYRSQGESAEVRRFRREGKTRVRLGGEPSALAPFPRRPSRMHKTTYDRLRAAARLEQG
jgi:hypothetical protein